MDWSVDGLRRARFEGWVSFEGLKAASPLPARPGVYVVIAGEDGLPSFRSDNPAGRRNGIDPTRSQAELVERIVSGTRVLYIGTATNIQTRVGAFRRNGEGRGARHWGGQPLWQIASARESLVAWKETPGLDPESVESVLLDSFFEVFTKLPFANTAVSKKATPEAHAKALEWLRALESQQALA